MEIPDLHPWRLPHASMVDNSALHTGQYGFRHCVVASTWAFEAQGPGSIPGGGAIRLCLRGMDPLELAVGAMLEPT